MAHYRLLTVAQILGSALDLGLGSDFLKEAHDSVVKSLIEIDSSFPRGEKIERGKFREYLGQKQSVALLANGQKGMKLTYCRYTVAWVDFFDEEFEQANGDWKKVTEEYLFAKDKMLMNGLDGGCKCCDLAAMSGQCLPPELTLA